MQTPRPIWPLEGSNFISGHELCLIFDFRVHKNVHRQTTDIMITIYPLFCQGVKNTADIFVNEKNAESFYLLGLLTFFQDFKMRQNADPVMTASPVCRDGSRTRNLEEWGVVSVINTM